MKVLHAFDVTLPVIAGYTTRSINILKNQVKIGIRPMATSSLRQTAEQGIVKEEFEGIVFHRPPQSALINRLKRFRIPLLPEVLEVWEYAKHIDRVRAAEQPDVIHAHSPILVGFAAWMVARKRNMPFVYEIRALWEDAAVDQGKLGTSAFKYKTIRFLESILIKKCDAVAVICEGLRREIQDRGVAREKIFVVPNGVECHRFSPLEPDVQLKRQLNIENNVIIGYLGTFFDFEGLDVLVEAMNLMKENRDIVCIIAGYGESEYKIKDLIRAYRLEDQVLMPGKIPHDQVNRYYSIIDILVYPRLRRRITEMVTPLKILEAMAMEKTVVGSDVGGIREIISDSEDGLLFKAENPASLVQQLDRLSSDPALAERLRKNARTSMLQKRNWEKIAHEYRKIYAHAITAHHR